jgi:outer membrane protein assembly factor BamB
MTRLALISLALGAACSGGPTIGYQPGSPWPKFRGGAAQDGLGAVRPTITNGAIWSFQTGKGVFSSPVVGADGTIYVGSADRTFYAIAPDGSLKWKLLTGEIIDSSALLDDRGRVYFGSGDGNLRALDAATGSLVWTTAADSPATNGAFINWFEGNVALSPGGRLYAGNDNFYLYGFDRSSGAITSRTRMPDQTWSLPAFDASTGEFYVGNNNVLDFAGSNLFAFGGDGRPAWEVFTGVGTVAASPMLTRDGAVVVGGFDGFVRAYDPRTGAVRWEFGARDHLYASPARLPDGTVLQAAADGSVYALDPVSGALRWEFDGRDPIRSSPAVDADGNSYFGAGDGRLWVLDKNGAVRWSVQLITDDRNDLNASPALGRAAIYIAGESGEVFSVPYDYCLGASGRADPRCAPPTAASLPTDGAVLLYTTPFGSQQATPPASIDANQPLVFSLVDRQAGHDALAVLDAADVTVTLDPPTPVTVDVSGDGKFLAISPDRPFAPASDGAVAISIQAGIRVALSRTGLKLSGGTPGGTASLQLRPTVSPPAAAPYVPSPGVTWELSRLALPLPTILPSYNQIGFDSLHYFVTMVEGASGHGVAWMAGARLAADENRTVIDPQTRALFPLEVAWAGGGASLINRDGVSVEVMNAVIPFRTFRLTASFGGDGSARGPVRLIGSTLCGGIPVYGSFLQQLGLCNPQTDALTVSGAANFTVQAGVPAPTGVGAVSFAATADAVTATLVGSSLTLADHVAAVLLVDAATGRPVTLDYGLTSQRTTDASGVLSTVRIPITGKNVPRLLRAYLMVDSAAVATATLTLP